MENVEVITNIVKRDGTIQHFDSKKITKAIAKAAEVTGEFDVETAKKLTIRAINIIQQLYADTTPNVENVQDIVEDVLLTSNYHKTAKAYILYRDQHARIREISSKFNVDLVDQYLQQLCIYMPNGYRGLFATNGEQSGLVFVFSAQTDADQANAG